MLILNIPELFGISMEVYLIVILLAFPTYFLWRRIYMRYFPVGKKRTLIIWLSTIISSPIIYVILGFIIFSIIDYYPESKFEKNRWDEFPDKRYELSQDIIKSKMLIGKSKTDVRLILGVDSTEPDSQNEWYIDLGYKPEIGNIDPSSLEINFKNNKVVSVTQSR
ncbi:MAG TPA: hypothetical protein VGQ53_11735 [Chitinophagaceae bacterium]|nr:hypothetical protein [Chitinophagaceae bacterium]